MKRVFDTSFIVFKPTLAEALQVNDPDNSRIFDYSFIQLSPNEKYRFITNSNIDINFSGNYKAEIIDLCGNVLLDITKSVFIYEGTNTFNGIDNIAIEVLNVGTAYYGNAVMFKISSTGEFELYSTPFCISPRTSGTVLLTYRDYGYKYGYDYTSFDFTQQIRIRANFTKVNNDTENKNYLQTTGNKISLESTISVSSNYLVEHITNHATEALTRALEHSVIFINNDRCTSASFTTDDTQAQANFYNGKMQAYINREEYRLDVNEISPIFGFTSKTPIGDIIGSVDEIIGEFNKNITLGKGTFEVWNKTTGARIKVYTEADITVLDNTFTVSDSGLATSVAEYYIKFTSGLFISDNNENISITNSSDWTFEITA